MTSDVTAVWTNHERENIQHQIARIDNRREDLQLEVERFEDLITEYEAELDDVSIDLAAGFKSLRLKDEADDLFRRITRDVTYYKNEIVNNGSRITEYDTKLITLKLKLNSISTSDITLKQSELRRQLKSDPRISDVRLKTAWYEGQPNYFSSLSFRVDNMIARVNNVTSNSTFGYRYLAGEHWHKLPPLRVHIYPGLIRFKPIRGHGRNYYSRSLSCHPHILRGARGEACLGDFGGPLTEALANQDLISAVSIALLFLEQIENHDAAGACWSKHDGAIPRGYVAPTDRTCLGRHRYTMPDGETYWAHFYADLNSDQREHFTSMTAHRQLFESYLNAHSSSILEWLRNRPDDSHFSTGKNVEFEFSQSSLCRDDLETDSNLAYVLPESPFPAWVDDDGTYGLWHIDNRPDPQSIDDLYLALQD